MDAAATTPRRSSPPTLEEYFELERTSAVRHEYHGNRIVAMAGGSANHGRIANNIAGEIRSRLIGRPCEGFNGETRIKVRTSDRFFYADASALCGKALFEADRGIDSLTNPSVIIEVLSPTTFRDDWNYKFDQYSLIESLTEYALVDQQEARVTILRRDPGGPWVFSKVVGLEGVASLRSIGVEIPLRLIYLNVDLSPTEAAGESSKSM